MWNRNDSCPYFRLSDAIGSRTSVAAGNTVVSATRGVFVNRKLVYHDKCAVIGDMVAVPAADGVQLNSILVVRGKYLLKLTPVTITEDAFNDDYDDYDFAWGETIDWHTELLRKDVDPMSHNIVRDSPYWITI